MCDNITYIFVSLEGYCVTTVDLLLNLLILFTGIIIVLLNGWIFGILCRHSDSEDTSYCFIGNLAAADFLIGIFVIYDVLYNILQFKIFIECLLRIGLFIAMNIASVFSLAALTIDRYIKITHPYLYISKCTLRKSRILTGIIWTFSIIIGILPFFGWNTKNILQICTYFGIMEGSYLIFIMCLYFVPFLIMIIVYIRVSILARRHVRDIKAMECHSAEVTSSKRSWKTFRTALLIVGAFFACWTPSGAFTLVVITTDVEAKLSARWSVNVIFTYLLAIGIFNSILNPIIYAAKVDVIKKRTKKLVLFRFFQRIRSAATGAIKPNGIQGTSATQTNTISTRLDDDKV